MYFIYMTIQLGAATFQEFHRYTWLLAFVLNTIGLGEKLNRKQAIEQWKCYDREMHCYGNMAESISTNLCRARKNFLEEVTLQLCSKGWAHISYRKGQELATLVLMLIIHEACKWEWLWCAGKTRLQNLTTFKTEIIMESKKNENEKTGKNWSMKSSANHVKEFGFYSKELILSKDFRSLFMELAILDWNVLLFTEIQGGVRQMEMTRLKQDDHLLKVMKSLVLH